MSTFIVQHHRSVLKKRAACIGTVQNEGDWAQPNKHFAKQKWHLYRQKPCLRKLLGQSLFIVHPHTLFSLLRFLHIIQLKGSFWLVENTCTCRRPAKSLQINHIFQNIPCDQINAHHKIPFFLYFQFGAIRRLKAHSKMYNLTRLGIRKKLY